MHLKFVGGFMVVRLYLDQLLLLEINKRTHSCTNANLAVQTWILRTQTLHYLTPLASSYAPERLTSDRKRVNIQREKYLPTIRFREESDNAEERTEYSLHADFSNKRKGIWRCDCL
jgi:hypothetical protein